MSGWRDNAACRGMDVDLFYPERGDHEGIAAAVAICNTCTVADHCLDWALTNREFLGILGGKTAKRREQIAGRTSRMPTGKPRPQAACGTYGGYKRHLRNDDPPCQPCIDANRAYGTAYKRRSKQSA